VRLVAVLAWFWEIRGEHTRILVLIGAVSEAVRGWTPPPAVVPAALAAGLAVLTAAVALADAAAAPVRDLLTRLGPEAAGDPRGAGGIRVLLGTDASSPAGPQAALERFASGSDRNLALPALIWLTHLRENEGDPLAAARAAGQALALTRPEDGPWVAAILHTQLADLTMRLGDTAAAHVHARAALPVLERLGALDDVTQLRTLLAFDAISHGRFDEAEELLAGDVAHSGTLLGGELMVGLARAELATARGQTADGLRRYLTAADEMRALRLPGVEPTGLEPWVLAGEAMALAAFARHATEAAQLASGRDLYLSCRTRCAALVRQDRNRPNIDYPVLGGVLFALGAWALRDTNTDTDTDTDTDTPCHGDDGPDSADSPEAEDAVRLLVLAQRFGYITTISRMDWARVVAIAERRAPGLLAVVRTGLGERRGAQLLGEVRSLVERLAGPAVPVGPL
jgi:hypothetical protein